MLEKAAADDFVGRFREIISDPLNLLIRRVPDAGLVKDELVCLHNGLKVPFSGPGSYYGDFSQVLSLNRGVHEPLEEYVFQQVLGALPTAPIMLELGAYWGHYSMWLKQVRSGATVYLVEPETANVEAGKANFIRNKMAGEFIQDFVGKGHFQVDRFLRERRVDYLDVLHSDIQGYEMEMLEACTDLLTQRKIGYAFVSTHSQQLHEDVMKAFESFGYRVEVAADFDEETTSYDGFVFASSPEVRAIFGEFRPLSRMQIAQSSPEDLLRYLGRVLQGG